MTHIPQPPTTESQATRLRRKIAQHNQMAQLARIDNDHKDAERHRALARAFTLDLEELDPS